MNKLKHLAIIMDGNGRWAKQKGMLRQKGHEAGVETVERICIYCAEHEILKLSLYAFSTENWNRPKSEVNALIKLLSTFLKTKKQMMINNNIKFNTIGRLDVFDEKLLNQIQDLKNATKNATKMQLNLAINYGGKDEIIRAANKLLKQKIADNQNIQISEEELQNSLDESDDIDLVIRTGGECRISNFMLWQSSYAEFAFTPTFFPDFNINELDAIINNFKLVKRKFGGL